MRSVLLVAAAAAVGFPSASAADPNSDYSIKQTRQLAYEYAKCVVTRHYAAASEALLNNVDNRTMMEKYRALIDGDCLVRSTHTSAKMSFPGDLYRYALADALVARELSSTAVADLSKVPPIARGSPPEPPVALPANASKADRKRHEDVLKSFSEAQSFRVLGEYGECVVRANPAAARALLGTEPETAAENSSFEALRLTFAECLPEGTTLTFGKVVLRGTIAENYYRLVHATHL